MPPLLPPKAKRRDLSIPYSSSSASITASTNLPSSWHVFQLQRPQSPRAAQLS